jgi:hypothetical protein
MSKYVKKSISQKKNVILFSVIRCKIDKNSQDIGDRDYVHPMLKEFWFKAPAFLIEGDFRPMRRIAMGLVKEISLEKISPFVAVGPWNFIAVTVDKRCFRRRVKVYVAFWSRWKALW